mgnify:CR=1 FL=1
MVTLERHLDFSEALVVQSLLAAHGVLSFLPDEKFIGVHWTRLFALGGVRIQVPQSIAEEAQALLDEVRTERVPPEPRPPLHVKRTIALLLCVLLQA